MHFGGEAKYDEKPDTSKVSEVAGSWATPLVVHADRHDELVAAFALRLTGFAPKTGAQLCEVEHICFVLSGRSGLRMRDGTEKVLTAGDVFAVPAGHDSWVIGKEPYVSLHLMGASDYGAQHRGR